MPRASSKPLDLASIEARRETLRAELAALDEQARQAEETARDAGRPTLLSALEKVKVADLSKVDARTIANAIQQHGGSAIALHLKSLG